MIGDELANPVHCPAPVVSSGCALRSFGDWRRRKERKVVYILFCTLLYMLVSLDWFFITRLENTKNKNNRHADLGMS